MNINIDNHWYVLKLYCHHRHTKNFIPSSMIIIYYPIPGIVCYLYSTSNHQFTIHCSSLSFSIHFCEQKITFKTIFNLLIKPIKKKNGFQKKILYFGFVTRLYWRWVILSNFFSKLLLLLLNYLTWDIVKFYIEHHAENAMGHFSDSVKQYFYCTYTVILVFIMNLKSCNIKQRFVNHLLQIIIKYNI